MAPRPREAGKKILIPRQFHLKNRFPRLRAFRENIQNHLLTIHHIDPGQTFQIPLLRRSQLRIEYEQFRVRLLRRAAHLFRLSGSQIVLRMRSADRDHRFSGNRIFECSDQFPQLFQMIPGFGGRFPRFRHADQIGAGFPLRFRRLLFPGEFIDGFLCQVPRHVFSV